MAGSPPPKGLVIDGDDLVELLEQLKVLEDTARRVRKLVNKHVKKYG